jgi:hypothetical protein
MGKKASSNTNVSGFVRPPVLFGQLDRLLKLFFGLTRTAHSMFLSATFLLEVCSKDCSLILTLTNAVRLTQEERSYIKQGMFVAFD